MFVEIYVNMVSERVSKWQSDVVIEMYLATKNPKLNFSRNICSEVQVMHSLCIRQESVRLEEFLEREITIIVQILPRQPADENTPKDKKPM